MGRLFKKFKIEKKKIETKEIPKVKKLNITQTHKKIKEKIDNSLDLLSIPSRQNTGLRKILELDEYTLNANIYLIARKILELMLESQDDLMFKILNRLIRCEKQKSIQKLMYSYLEVFILGNLPYERLFDFIFRHFNSIFLENRVKLLEIVSDNRIKEKICKLQIKTPRYLFEDRIYFNNGCFELVS